MKPTYEQWAAKELDVEPGTEVGTARSAFLARLDADQLLPAENMVAAWNHWAEYGVPVSRQARGHTGSSPSLDAFLAEFWSLSPALREVRWKELFEDDPSATDARRLLNLKSGLSVSTETRSGDAKIDEMAALLRELFLLPARRRATRRREWLNGLERPEEWYETVGEMLNSEPLVLELDPTLIWWMDRMFDALPVTVETSRNDSSWSNQPDDKSHFRTVRQSRTQDLQGANRPQSWFCFIFESWYRTMFLAMAIVCLIGLIAPSNPAPVRRDPPLFYPEGEPPKVYSRRTFPAPPPKIPQGLDPNRPWLFDPAQLNAPATRR